MKTRIFVAMEVGIQKGELMKIGVNSKRFSEIFEGLHNDKMSSKGKSRPRKGSLSKFERRFTEIEFLES